MYTAPAAGYVRTGIFPHGAKKKGIGVVSDRAIKHVHHLVQLAAAGAVPLPPRVAAALGGAAEEGGSERRVEAAVLFIVNRWGCQAVRGGGGLPLELPLAINLPLRSPTVLQRRAGGCGAGGGT